MPTSKIKQFANLDGFRVYKVKNRGDRAGDRLYIAPVYIIGLPGDIDLINKEFDVKQEKKIEAYVKGLTAPKEIHLP